MITQQTQEPLKIDTSALLEQQAAYEEAKANHIKALLGERELIIKEHEQRLEEIARDLKALGYVKPRAPRVKKEKK